MWDHIKGLTEVKIDHCKATGAVYVCVTCVTCLLFLSVWAATYSCDGCGYVFVCQYYISVTVWTKS